MDRVKIKEGINEILIKYPHINSVLDGDIRSDHEVSYLIDTDIIYYLIVDNEFNNQQLFRCLGLLLDDDCIYSFFSPDKIVFYTNEIFCIEFVILIDSISLLQQEKISFLVGQTEQNMDKYLLLDKSDIFMSIKSDNKLPDFNSVISDLINDFIYNFERSSNAHRRCDSFLFNRYYNRALEALIYLYVSLLNKTVISESRYLLTKIQADSERNKIFDLHSTFRMYESNLKKKNLLWLFFDLIKSNNILLDKRAPVFLDFVFDRDYLWNIRDLSKYNKNIKKGFLFRSATLSRFNDDPILDEFINNNNLSIIVDLRGVNELKELEYSQNLLDKVKYVNIPFDPWNPPLWFKKDYWYGSKEEITYRFFFIACKNQMKHFFQIIINSREEDVILFHCFSGRYRTGILSLLLYLISGGDINLIKKDYYASEAGVKKHRLDMILKLLEEQGGYLKYLLSCGLSLDDIDLLRKRIIA